MNTEDFKAVLFKLKTELDKEASVLMNIADSKLNENNMVAGNRYVQAALVLNSLATCIRKACL